MPSSSTDCSDNRTIRGIGVGSGVGVGVGVNVGVGVTVEKEGEARGVSIVDTASFCRRREHPTRANAGRRRRNMVADRN
jgi:hypothetical protein